MLCKENCKLKIIWVCRSSTAPASKPVEVKKAPSIIPPGSGSRIIHPLEDLSLVSHPVIAMFAKKIRKKYADEPITDFAIYLPIFLLRSKSAPGCRNTRSPSCPHTPSRRHPCSSTQPQQQPLHNHNLNPPALPRHRKAVIFLGEEVISFLAPLLPTAVLQVSSNYSSSLLIISSFSSPREKCIFRKKKYAISFSSRIS